MFRFAHPDFLYLLFLLPALVAFYVYAMIVKKKAIKKYGNPTLLAEFCLLYTSPSPRDTR